MKDDIDHLITNNPYEVQTRCLTGSLGQIRSIEEFSKNWRIIDTGSGNTTKSDCVYSVICSILSAQIKDKNVFIERGTMDPKRSLVDKLKLKAAQLAGSPDLDRAYSLMVKCGIQPTIYSTSYPTSKFVSKDRSISIADCKQHPFALLEHRNHAFLMVPKYYKVANFDVSHGKI